MKNIAILAASIFIVFSGFFIKPAPFAYAQGTPTQGAGLEVDTNIENAISTGCATSNIFSGPCALSLFYSAIVEPSFYLVGVAAKILDFFLGYSLDSNAYRGDFVEKGWALIRDISNVAFIFTLLYLAIKHILGDSAKRAIPTLIIVALLLNFSLFFTKIIIDAGNILARAFYNSIVIENDQTYQGNENYKSITFGIVDKINPQKLFSAAIFSGGEVTGEFNTVTNQYEGPVAPVIKDKTGTIFAVFIMMIIVNGFLMWTFLSVALIFVGRVIGLWFMMIFSPIAFITLAVPGSGGFLKQLSFDSWKDTVLKLAFVAPVFIFFLYLTISFLSILGTGEDLVPSASTDIFMDLMKIFIPFIFIIVLLQAAKKTAESMAGDFGSTVKSLVGKAMGMVAGATLGATAFAGRRVIGAAAGRNLTLGNYQERIQQAEQAGDTATARRLTRKMETMKKIYASSFDIRNAGQAKGVAGWAARQVGSGLSAGMSGFGGDKFVVGQGSKESRKKYVDEIKKERLDLAQELGEIGENEDSEIRMRELRRQRSNAQIARRELVRTGQNTQAIDADIARYNTDMQRIQGAQSEITQTRRNLFANRLEDSIYESLIAGVENRELHADEIRQGNRSRSAEQRALDAIRALGTPPPPPPTPPPPVNPPAGGGGGGTP